MWTVSVYGVSAGWMRAVRGSGRHLIKKVAAHLRQLDFGSRAEETEWVGVWA